MARKWTMKYKKSINCKKPKGFSQKQYCKYGRTHKKRRKTMKGGIGERAAIGFGRVLINGAKNGGNVLLGTAKSGAKSLSEEIAKDAIKQEIFKQKYSNEIGKNYNENVNPNMHFNDENKENFMNSNMRVYDENKKKFTNPNKNNLSFTPPPPVDFSEF